MADNEVMDATNRAVVDDPTKPLMDGGPALMDPVPSGAASAADGGGQAGDEMAPMEQDGSDMDPMDAAPPSIEEPRAFDPGGDDVGDGYLRLNIRLENGELSVVGARIVDGPLLQPDPTGELFYQAVIGDRRIGVGGLPDLEEERGFAPEDDPAAGHGIAPSDGNEFVVRIPRQDITAEELDELEIELVRPSETSASPAPGQTLEAAAAEEGRDAPEVVARLHGIDLGQTPDDQVEALRRRLR